MRRLRQELKWWGLFALIPLAVTLIVLDDFAPLTPSWRLSLLAGIAVVICLLALRWVERNPGLMAGEGTDAEVVSRTLLVINERGPAEPVVRGYPAGDAEQEAGRDGRFAQLGDANESIAVERVP